MPTPPCAPQMAFRYLSWILFPLLGCYAVYSLLYLEHKGWYSWVLSMLYGFLLTFGEQALSRRSSAHSWGPVWEADSPQTGTTQGGQGWHMGRLPGGQVHLGPHPQGNPHSNQVDRRLTARAGYWEGVTVRGAH